MRLIDLEKVVFDCSGLAYIDPLDFRKTAEYFMRQLKEQPTIEPERKKGRWVAKEDRQKQEVFICSECGGWAYSPWIGSRKNPKPNRCKYTFCPNCGADMRERRTDGTD